MDVASLNYQRNENPSKNNKMIIISLFGGLGNQMFQYSTAKAISLKLGVELKLDTSLLEDRTPKENFTYRDYEFSAFNIDEKIANTNEVRRFVPNLWNSSKTTLALFKIKRAIFGTHYYWEKHKFEYDAFTKSLKDNTYIYGYFQSEKYFAGIRPQLLESFRLRTNPNEANMKLLAQIQAENSVSIHIRRGDYKNSPFQLLEMDSYYLKAIKSIEQKIDSPVFYIFTNDIAWTEKQFKTTQIKKVIVNINTESQSYMDMILMSHCQHNICANSSFSWWGAWLNSNPKKVVIVPKKWFKDKNLNTKTSDLIPEGWNIL